MTTDLPTRLETAIDALDVEAVAATMAVGGTGDREDVKMLNTYVAESRVALRLIGPHLRPGMRVLEVGSGIGFTARFLHDVGVELTELEPVGQGFDFIARARRALAAGAGPTHIDVGIEEVDADLHGRFDLIYSLNVLEHVDDWRVALDAAMSVLAPGGRIIASCPNYAVPYEPHFGIPLVPVRPAFTGRLLPRRITATGLWRSLNWISLGQVRRWARGRKVDIVFERGLLARVSDRLNDDHEFAKRHGGALRTIARILRISRLDRVLAALPPAIVTPMEFVVERSR